MKEVEQIQVELQDTMGSDAAIANAAWTSTYDKDRREDKYDDPAKVVHRVRDIVQLGHSVPVESVIFRFWIRMPIFTDRQHMTHRIASHNGLSGRYRTMPSDFYKLPSEINTILDKIGGMDAQILKDRYYNTLLHEWEVYEGSINVLKEKWKSNVITNKEYKRCREVFRGILGTSFMVERTSIFNLRSLCNYIKLRKSEHAQPEIRYVAEQMYRLVKESNICPIAFEELEKKGWIL